MSLTDVISHTLGILPGLRRTPLPTAIDAPVSVVPSRAGDLFVYESALSRGAPVVLIHSINAAASSYEMRPLFEALQVSRPVIALDLPGFGLSERGNRRYDRELFRTAIEAVLERARDRHGIPADVVALSLGCELAALATLDRPELVRSLTMISPTGFNLPKADSASERVHLSERLLGILGAPLYAVLSSRVSIDHYLGKSFEGAVDRGLARYDWLTAHQPGARFAPLAFLSGKLFDTHVRQRIYEKLERPVHVIYDTDPYTTFATLHTAADYRAWTVTRVSPTRGMPHFERPDRTLQAMETFWGSLDAPHVRNGSGEAHKPFKFDDSHGGGARGR